MDAVAAALKGKMKKSPAPSIKDDLDKQAQDMAPEVKDDQPPSNNDQGDAEVSMLKKMGAGTPIGRKPSSLGERAKGKMNERMASIMKNKKSK